ncbi:hypothetical protein ACFSTH_19945 [Paenibacillus yanchengensis]|uniref:Lipoprotein n=1 Tax=Paenibacillus yanchengensis TaxID=2035833 RepID=A0ABW4YMY7_9BACL
MKRALQAISLMVALSLLLVGCGGAASKPLKDTLLAAAMKTAGAGSYVMDASFKIDKFDMTEGAIDSEELAVASEVAAVVKDAAIQAKAIYNKEAGRTDVDLQLVLPGFMNMSLNVPIIMNGDNIYFKAPQIPFLPLPPEVTDKYIALDLKQLAEQAGEPMPSIDIAAQQKLAQEIATAAMKHFDDKKYFTDVKLADAGLPEQVKANKVVKFSLNDSNYEETITVLLEKALPEIIDIILKNEDYLTMIGIEKAELENVKQQLTAEQAVIKAFFQNNLKINKVEVVSAIDKDYLVHQVTNFDVEIKDEESGETIALALTASVNYTDVDKKPAFTQEIPTETVPFDQLLGGMMMDPSLFLEDEAVVE